jgi:acyl-CoA synthetase (AMP-forming)/AMP-acid ligase II
MEWIDVTTFGDLLLRTADRVPSADAVVFPGERFSYRDVADRSIEVARGLRALGVGPGDHVGILMANSPEYVFAFFGITLLGGVIVPINARYRSKELAYVIENADLVTLLTSDLSGEYSDFIGLLRTGLPGLDDAEDPEKLDLDSAPQLRNVVVFGTQRPDGMIGQAQFERRAASVPADEVLQGRARVSVRDVALMPYTSGTTADPKGCLLTHEAMVRDWMATAARIDLGAGDGFWAPCPMFHNATIGPMLSAFAKGARLLSMVYFEPQTAIEMIEREQATHLFGAFPTITMAMLRHPEYEPSRFDSVRLTINVAPPETLRLMQDLTPNAIQVSAFGLTEGSGTSTMNRLSDTVEQRTETCGHPLEGVQLKIIDPATGRDQPTGVTGEILFRGFNTLEGYYRDPEKTRATIEQDGWVHTGDLGKLGAEGRLTYVGRLKDMLKVGGENVAPSEIESHLSTHPAVHLVQVVGGPDERYGEVPVAFVELAAGQNASEAELMEHCRGQIASFKVPRGVRFVTEWPMSATKIQKFRLREVLDAEADADAGGTS